MYINVTGLPNGQLNQFQIPYHFCNISPIYQSFFSISILVHVLELEAEKRNRSGWKTSLKKTGEIRPSLIVGSTFMKLYLEIVINSLRGRSHPVEK